MRVMRSLAFIPAKNFTNKWYDWDNGPFRIKNGMRVAENFNCRSNNNTERMGIETLQIWIVQNREKVSML
jgi:hypothetical protein